MRTTEPGLTGVVLTGGRSVRMGRDKASLEIHGESLLAQTLAKLAAVCTDILIAIGPADRQVLPANVEARTDISFVNDLDGLKGPAAGILAAARARPEQSLLVLACDLPNLTAEVLAAISAQRGDWVVPRHQDRLEPLCSLYRPPSLSALEQRAARGDFALHHLADEALSIAYFEGSDFDSLGDPQTLFHNLNTPGDLAAAERLS